MADYTFIEMKEWFYNNAPKIINEKYFLYVMGSIFLLGIFTKWLVAFGYGRMIRKAEHMSNPKNATLRQIKMKYDSIKEINGHVANPMIFAARSLNKCKLGIFSLNKLNNIINVCIILSVTLAVGTGFGIYLTGKSKIEAIVYVLIGYFFGMVLDMINRSTKISEKQTELTYILVDYLEESVVVRENGHMEKPGNENIVQEKKSETSTNNKEFEADEQILNQVIGEFLQ